MSECISFAFSLPNRTSILGSLATSSPGASRGPFNSGISRTGIAHDFRRTPRNAVRCSQARTTTPESIVGCGQCMYAASAIPGAMVGRYESSWNPPFFPSPKSPSCGLNCQKHPYPIAATLNAEPSPVLETMSANVVSAGKSSSDSRSLCRYGPYIRRRGCLTSTRRYTAPMMIVTNRAIMAGLRIRSTQSIPVAGSGGVISRTVQK